MKSFKPITAWVTLRKDGGMATRTLFYSEREAEENKWPGERVVRVEVREKERP